MKVTLPGACLCCLAVGLWPLGGSAQTPPVSASPVPSAPPGAALEAVSPGVYRLGLVTLDKAARQVRFPAVVNQTAGPVEYLLVGVGGKVHESVLRTAASPTQVHAALLLLGLHTLQENNGPARPAPPAALDQAYLASAPLPSGVPVTLLVRWQPAGGGPPVEPRAETLVDNAATRGAMTDGFWLYNGSLVVEGRFEAEAEKSFVSVVTDPAALINNPRPGHDDESLWTAATARLPEAGTPVEFIIQLPAPGPPSTHD